jgi:hypothetical protein
MFIILQVSGNALAAAFVANSRLVTGFRRAAQSAPNGFCHRPTKTASPQ